MTYFTNKKDFPQKNIKYFFVLVFLLVSSHQIFNFDALPYTFLILYFLLGLGIIVVPLTGDKIFPVHSRLGRPTFSSIMVGITISLPTIIYFLFTFNQDLPLWGDHQAHTAMSYGTITFWAMSPGIENVSNKSLQDINLLNRATILGLLALLTSIVLKYKHTPATCWLMVSSWAAMVIFLSATGNFEHLRYPSAGYFFDMPFNTFVYLFDQNRLWNGPRIGSALAPVIWLFVLRPVLIKRWPSIDILPWAILIFWLPESLHYFSSSYLEPWAIICTLLAIELIVRYRSEGAAGALLLTGVAACVKEPFIIALPAIWLIGKPWQEIKKCVELSTAGLIAGLPFLSYLYLRYDSPAPEVTMAQRGFTVRSDWKISEDLTFHFGRLFESVGMMASGFLIMSGILLLGMCFTKRFRTVSVANIVTATLIFLLFFADHVSAKYAGFYRFAMPYIPFIASGLLITGIAFGKKTQLFIVLIALCLVGPGMIRATGDTLKPDPVRAGIEWGSSPVFIGFPSLVNKAINEKILPKNVTVAIESLPPLTHIFSSPPRFIKNNYYSIKLVEQDSKESCQCSQHTPYRFKPFMRMGDDRTISVDAYGTRCPRDMARDQCLKLSNVNSSSERCMKKMLRTCEEVITKNFDGHIYAIFGIGVRKNSNIEH